MRLEAALALAQSERPIADSGEDWDADPWLLAVANGVVDLRTGALSEGRPDDRITMHSPVPYDPEAQCPRWLVFLREVFGDDDELIDFIWRACAYSLSGLTNEECHFLCFGSGCNGKGTLNRVQRDILGDYAANTAFSTLEMSSRNGIPNDLAALYGKRLVTASELNEAVRLNEARMKMLAGQDPVTARFLHGEFFTFVPNAKFWLAVNHKPMVNDDSTGFWRKIRSNRSTHGTRVAAWRPSTCRRPGKRRRKRRASSWATSGAWAITVSCPATPPTVGRCRASGGDRGQVWRSPTRPTTWTSATTAAPPAPAAGAPSPTTPCRRSSGSPSAAPGPRTSWPMWTAPSTSACPPGSGPWLHV
jgi:hypothetical protein